MNFLLLTAGALTNPACDVVNNIIGRDNVTDIKKWNNIAYIFGGNKMHY